MQQFSSYFFVLLIWLAGHGPVQAQTKPISMEAMLYLLLEAASDSTPPTRPEPGATQLCQARDGAEIVVNNRSELLAAARAAQGGEVIVLNDGHYGEIRINERYSEQVCFQARNHLQARFGDVDIIESRHILIEGFDIQGQLDGDYSSFAMIKNNRMRSAVFKFSDNARYDGNDSNYVNFNDSSYFELTNNFIHHAPADLLHLRGNAHHFLVENNILFDTIPDDAAHSDAIQMSGNRNGNPHHFTLRGNYVFDDPSTVQSDAINSNKKLQGFFIADARGDGYHNVLIENNLINASNTSNSLMMAGASHNVIIRNNTLLPSAVGTGGGIRVTEFPGASHENIVVTKNVAFSLRDRDAPNAQDIDNIFYGIRGQEIPLSTLFENHQAFGTWRNFIPKAGSLIDFGSGYGAEQRVQELQNE